MASTGKAEVIVIKFLLKCDYCGHTETYPKWNAEDKVPKPGSYVECPYCHNNNRMPKTMRFISIKSPEAVAEMAAD